MKKRMPYYRKNWAFVLACMLLIFVCVVPVSAIGVSGAKYMNSIAPGKSDFHNITVSLATTDKAADVSLAVKGFGQALGQNYLAIEPAEDTSPYSARQYITLSQSTVHLEPGQSATISAKITLPQNVGDGGRYAIIAVGSISKTGEFVSTGVNIPLLITVDGTTQTKTGTIQSVDTGTVILGQPIKIITLLKNTGNYHYYNTKNTITIIDSSGNIVSEYSTDPSIFAVIPGNTVKYVASPVIQNLPIGVYTVKSKVLLEDGTILDEKSATLEVKTNYVPPVTESNITLTPSKAGTLTSPDGRYSFSFPKGAVLGDAIVTLKPYSKDKLMSAPAGAKIGATSFEITGISGLLNDVATVKVAYSDDDLAVAGGDASQLKLAFYDAAKGSWVILPTQNDPQNKALTTTTNHLGVWAVMASSSPTGSSPVASSTQSPVPETIVLASLVFATIIVGVFSRKRK